MMKIGHDQKCFLEVWFFLSEWLNVWLFFPNLTMILVIVVTNSKMMREAVFYSQATFTELYLCAMEDRTVLILQLTEEKVINISHLIFVG